MASSDIGGAAAGSSGVLAAATVGVGGASGTAVVSGLAAGASGADTATMWGVVDVGVEVGGGSTVPPLTRMARFGAGLATALRTGRTPGMSDGGAGGVVTTAAPVGGSITGAGAVYDTMAGLATCACAATRAGLGHSRTAHTTAATAPGVSVKRIVVRDGRKRAISGTGGALFAAGKLRTGTATSCDLTAASIAFRNSRADWKRAAGSLASALATTGSSATGTSGFDALGGCGTVSTWAHMTANELSAS